jgi:branched-chain amino acid aminotransferase
MAGNLLKRTLPTAGKALGAATPSVTAAVTRPFTIPSPSTQTTRYYSIKPEHASAAKPLDIDPSKLVITTTSTPKTPSDPKTLVFGREFTGERAEPLGTATHRLPHTHSL